MPSRSRWLVGSSISSRSGCWMSAQEIADAVQALFLMGRRQGIQERPLHRGSGREQVFLRQIHEMGGTRLRHLAAIRRLGAREYLQQRGLPGAIGPDQPQALARVESESDARKQDLRPVGFAD